MKIIVTALYNEAEPFIKLLKLKKDTTQHMFEVFKNDSTLLIISGVGKIKAAIATTYICSLTKNITFLVNIGICATYNSSHKIGDIFLCNKIIEKDTNKTFYPDILFKHPFYETSIETNATSITHVKHEQNCLIDMEASGIYQAALMFLQTHTLFFIKIVSDYANPEILKSFMITQYISQHAQIIIEWLSHIEKNILVPSLHLPKNIEILFEKISINLHLSVTMKNELYQLLIYQMLENNDCLSLLEKYETILCKSKIERKRYFVELKSELLP